MGLGQVPELRQYLERGVHDLGRERTPVQTACAQARSQKKKAPFSARGGKNLWVNQKKVTVIQRNATTQSPATTLLKNP